MCRNFEKENHFDMQKIKTPISMKIKTRRDLEQDEKTTVLNDQIVS